jgi:hypothetical protein
MNKQKISVSDWYAGESETVSIGHDEYITALRAGGWSWGQVKGDEVTVLGSGLDTKVKALRQIMAQVKKQELVARIKGWCYENYSAGGSWIVETMTDSEIGEQFKSLASAKKYAKTIKSREDDCRGW